MKVLRVTYRLRRVASLLFLMVPLFVYQVYELSNLPMHVNSMQFLRPYVMGSFIFGALLYVLVLKGIRAAFEFVKVFAVIWCSVSVFTALVESNFLLGVHSVVLVTYWVFAINLIKFEMGRSFFDPRLKWYQSTPKPIPHLMCSIQGRDEKFRVSRMDADGVFVFLDQKKHSSDVTKELVKSKLEMDLIFKDRAIKCNGRTMTALNGGLGFGIQFAGMNLDDKKELGDFVSCLHGEGFF